MNSMPDDDAIQEALRQVDDPEVGMNIVDLGLVYGIQVGENAIYIDITMTTAACPMADMIMNNARDVIRDISPAGTEIEINLVWEPPWSPDKMTGLARDHFGWAPP